MLDIVQEKKQNSLTRVKEFSEKLKNVRELEELGNLGIFVSGSYARNEASVHSDIDLFFVLDGKLEEVELSNLKTMRAFSKVIEIADKMKFPTFSNDGEFLKILEKGQILTELGGRNDDYLNYFTARMLLLLESKPVYGNSTYDEIIRDIVGAYFRDYTHHPKDFRPTFLINDIIRFWKTLCLNYEHKRNQPKADQQQRIKQKIKNLKLKFSRMLTCFGSIAAIIDMDRDIGPEEIIALRTMSPMQRLEKVVENRADLAMQLKTLKFEYEWFLRLTNVSGEELLNGFSNEEQRELAFRKADQFGDAMYNIVRTLAEEKGYLRYLLI